MVVKAQAWKLWLTSVQILAPRLTDQDVKQNVLTPQFPDLWNREVKAPTSSGSKGRRTQWIKTGAMCSTLSGSQGLVAVAMTRGGSWCVPVSYVIPCVWSQTRSCRTCAYGAGPGNPGKGVGDNNKRQWVAEPRRVGWGCWWEGLSNAPLMFCLSYFLKVNDSNCDQELLSLLLDAKLLVKCISTPFYLHVIEHLLASPQQGRWDVEQLARHLREAGHEAEAGSLLLAVRGTHRALRTFSTALSAGQHWLWAACPGPVRHHLLLNFLAEKSIQSWMLFQRHNVYLLIVLSGSNKLQIKLYIKDKQAAIF